MNSVSNRKIRFQDIWNTWYRFIGDSCVQSFWYGSKLSPYEMLSIRSFLDHGHSYHLYTYSNDLQVPRGCKVMDAREILTEDKVVFYQSGPGKGSVALFANLFRYELLFRKGGWWVDTDVICNTRSLPESEYSFGFEDEDKTVVCNAVIKVPPRSKLMEDCFQASRSIGTDAHWGQTGPKLLTQLIYDSKLEAYIKPMGAYYPYSWKEWKHAFDPEKLEELIERCAKSHTFHLWNEFMRRNNVCKFSKPPAGSFIEDFFKKHEIIF